MESRITFRTIGTRPIEQHLCEIIFNLCQKFRYSLFISQLLPMLAIRGFSNFGRMKVIVQYHSNVFTSG